MSYSVPQFARRSNAVTRSISAENPTGEPGKGGMTASKLGPKRKGRPCIDIEAGETAVLADIAGPGVIRHIWITCPRDAGGEPFVLRNLVVRCTWDDAQAPAVEVPLGDFFGSGFGEVAVYSSEAMVVAPNGGLNCFIPMPFRERAVIEIVSEHGTTVEGFFYQIDYSLGDALDEDVMYFHSEWRRTNGDNERGVDHVIADVHGVAGSYVGTQVSLTQLERYWYGEGELKFFIDGDDEYPTICGTGLEDYVGGAWGFQDRMSGSSYEISPTAITFNSPYLGYHQQVFADHSGVSPYAREMPPGHGMYRWHLHDPVRFESDLTITLQQIGDRGGHLFERRDDIVTVAYWYQAGTADGDYRLPPMADRQPR